MLHRIAVDKWSIDQESNVQQRNETSSQIKEFNNLYAGNEHQASTSYQSTNECQTSISQQSTMGHVAESVEQEVISEHQTSTSLQRNKKRHAFNNSRLMLSCNYTTCWLESHFQDEHQASLSELLDIEREAEDEQSQEVSEQGELIDAIAIDEGQGSASQQLNNQHSVGTAQTQQSSNPDQEILQRIVKLEDTIDVAREAINKLNKRIGDEVIDSDDSLLSDDDHPFETVVNTREYQRDHWFNRQYFYITNVCIYTSLNNIYASN